jgi:UDP-glucose 4-epimerase
MKIISEDLLINDTINIGNNKMIEIKELAKIIKKVLKSKSKIKYIEPLKEGDMSRRQPDISKMLKLYKNDLTGIESGVMNIYRSLKR